MLIIISWTRQGGIITGWAATSWHQSANPSDRKICVHISAHVSGDFDDYYMEGTKLFAENLRRYLDGKELLNVIDKEARYQTSGPHYR